MFEQVKAFVQETFSGPKAGGIKHFEQTVFWLKKLKPDADEPMLIAAYAHDIERGFRKRER